MKKINVKITGLEKIKKNMLKGNARAKKALAAGMYGKAGNIMAESQREVPVNYGVLKSSGYVTLPQMKPDNIEVELGYGGMAKEYAVPQHERTDFNHPEGGKAKYLEDPAMRAAGTLGQDINKIARANFKMNLGITKGQYPTKPGGKS